MTPLLNAKKISLHAKGRKDPIIYETDITINEGDFVVVLGANGSGKSSLVKILSGLKEASMGNVYLNGKEFKNIDSLELSKYLITLSQKVDDKLFIDMTLEENASLWESRYGKNARLSYDKICELTPNPSKFIALKKQLVGLLSGGEKQAFLFALVLAHPPSVLFLDEHTSALDYKTAKEIMCTSDDNIKKHKITTVMVTHELEDAVEYGNKLIILSEGKIVYNDIKPKEINVNDIKKLIYAG